MEANYVHKDSTTLVQDELVKNELNQIELQYNALKQQKFNELLKENQELKEKYLNAVADYETTMFEKEQLNSLVNSCQEEIRRLKKQLEECQLQNFDLREDIMIQKQAIPNKLIKDKTFYDLYDMPTYEDLLNQQKEFIEYMNKTIKELECDDVDDEEMKGYLIQRIDTFKEILQKYKNIIGVLDDNKTML